MVRTGDKPWCDARCVLDHCAKQRAYMACEVVVGRSLGERSVAWLVVMLCLSMKRLNEHSLNVTNRF